MAEIVEFDGAKIGTSTKYQLMDSGENIKKTIKYYSQMLTAVDEMDDTVIGAIEQSAKLTDIIAEAICDLFNLNAQQSKRVKALEFSFSDEYNFFNECLAKFLGLTMPSLEDNQETEDEDPK